eukprot:s3070_g4.t8
MASLRSAIQPSSYLVKAELTDRSKGYGPRQLACQPGVCRRKAKDMHPFAPPPHWPPPATSYPQGFPAQQPFPQSACMGHGYPHPGASYPGAAAIPPQMTVPTHGLNTPPSTFVGIRPPNAIPGVMPGTIPGAMPGGMPGAIPGTVHGAMPSAVPPFSAQPPPVQPAPPMAMPPQSSFTSPPPAPPMPPPPSPRPPAPAPSAKDGAEGAKAGGSEWTGQSFEDTIGEAKRRAEEARKKFDEEQRKSRRTHREGEERPPASEEELLELQAWLSKFPTLDSKALNALKSLDAKDAVHALKELEQKGPGIRNPSAWICKTAQNVRERRGLPPLPEEEKEKEQEKEKKNDLGIVDHYGALEVAEDADEKDIKKAYRKLVLKWHPDKHPEGRDEAEEKIRAINNAYETLSNATKRATYDAQRQALLRSSRGQGPDLKAQNLAPRQRIPREFMLQPIGYPNKFVRYGDERARAQCEVNSRADARLDGKSGLDQFVPFFKAAKLSLWWLPDVNNMCRIRALEARTRSSAGEKVVAGRPGGFNLAFEIDVRISASNGRPRAARAALQPFFFCSLMDMLSDLARFGRGCFVPAVTTDGISAEAEWSSRMCACIERGQLHESDVFGRAAADQVIFQAPDSSPRRFDAQVNDHRESDLRLVEAGKGEKNENVNFIVISSPLYDNAFRFEAAFRRGYFLAFRPPTQLRMIPYSGGPLPKKVIIDFTLVDFQAMFKFIDIEEVLRPAIEKKGGWVTFEEVKADANVVAYFGNILQKPMWDDDDFQTYFEGHFEMWEFRCADSRPEVRLRGVDERLGYALERAKDPDVAAELVVTAGDELKGLHWRYVLPVFEVLSRGQSDDVSAVVQRMEAQRQLLSSLLGGVLSTAGEADLADLARFARALQPLSEGTAPDVANRSTEACSMLSKLVLARAAAAEKGTVADVVKLDDLRIVLMLPGMSSHSNILARITSPPLAEAPLAKILEATSGAAAAKAMGFAKEAAQLALHQVGRIGTSPAAVHSVVLALANNGLLLDGCASLLAQHCALLPTEDLASAVAAVGDQGHEGPQLVAACKNLAARGAADFAVLSFSRLQALAVAATKSGSLSFCSSAVMDAAVQVLSQWQASEAIRLVLALAKPRRTEGKDEAPEVPSALWASLLSATAAKVRPALSELPAAELIRLALAAKTHAEQGGKELLEGVAVEAVRRLADLPQAHLLLLTQGLTPLGGKHPQVREICNYWSEVLGEDPEKGDEVSKRRKEVERGQALNGDQVAKLALIFEALSSGLDTATSDRCFSSLGKQLLLLTRSPRNLPAATRETLLDQIRRGQGVGLWESGRETLRRALDKRSRSRRRSSSSSRSRSRGRTKRRKSPSRDRSRGRSSATQNADWWHTPRPRMLILSAAVARGTFVLCEYDASPGSDDLTEVSRKVLPKIPRTGAIKSYVYGGHTFNYLLDKELIFLCIASPTAGTEMVFEFLSEFRRSFEAQTRRLGHREDELARMLRDLISRYNSDGGGKMQQMERDLEDVADITQNALAKVIERGERIDSLLDKTAALKSESVSFRTNAKRYNDDLWWRDQRGRMLLGIVAMAVIVVITFLSVHQNEHVAAERTS